MAFCSYWRVPLAVAAKVMLASLGWSRAVRERHRRDEFFLGVEVGRSRWRLSEKLAVVTSFKEYQVEFEMGIGEEPIKEKLTTTALTKWLRMLDQDAPVFE